MQWQQAMGGRWPRVALAGTGIVAAALLVAATLTSHAGVRTATDLVLRGQVATILDAVRVRFRAARSHGGRPDAGDLGAILHGFEAAGLRYLALADEDGALQVAVGTTTTTLTRVPLPPLQGTWSRADDRLRVVLPLHGPPMDRPGDGPPPGWPRPPAHDGEPLGPPPGLGTQPRPPGAGPGPGPGDEQPRPIVALELAPDLIARLGAEAERTLIAGIAGAALLVLGVLALLHLARRARDAERRLADKRELERLGQMSAVLAHEMRNPIAAIKGNLQLLVERFADRPRDRDKTSRVLDETVRLEALTESLLAFVRSGAIAPELASPVAVLQAAATNMSTVLTLELEAAPATWWLDPVRLERAVANLLQNAVQASPEPGSVTVRMAVEAGALVIEVRDRGPGIAPEALPHVFEPFVTSRLQGTGLGLAVARQVVEAHGGTLRAANAEGGGAVLSVTLPDGGPRARREG